MRINSHGLLSVWHKRAKSERFSEDVTTVKIKQHEETTEFRFFSPRT